MFGNSTMASTSTEPWERRKKICTWDHWDWDVYNWCRVTFTNSTPRKLNKPLKICHPKTKVVFQPSLFSGKLLNFGGVSFGYHWGGLNHSDSRQGGKCVKADGPATMTFYQYSAQKKVRAKMSATHAVRGGGIMVVTNPLLRPAISLGETWHWGRGPVRFPWLLTWRKES